MASECKRGTECALVCLFERSIEALTSVGSTVSRILRNILIHIDNVYCVYIHIHNIVTLCIPHYIYVA